MEAILVNHDGKHLIRLRGPMTAADAEDLGGTIDSLLAEGGYCFTLDLCDVPSLDDLSAGAIQTVAARLSRRGASFQIANALASVRSAITNAPAK
jgi:MFS superfamily sulfate permease-like transporter